MPSENLGPGQVGTYDRNCQLLPHCLKIYRTFSLAPLGWASASRVIIPAEADSKVALSNFRLGVGGDSSLRGPDCQRGSRSVFQKESLEIDCVSLGLDYLFSCLTLQWPHLCFPFHTHRSLLHPGTVRGTWIQSEVLSQPTLCLSCSQQSPSLVSFIFSNQERAPLVHSSPGILLVP